MFFAHKSSFHQDIFDRNSVFFSTAELPLFEPWFLCEVPEYEDDEILTYTTHLFADLDALTAFTIDQKPTKTYVVSPGYLNKSDNWMMQRLKTVAKAKYTHEHGSGNVFRFEFDNGDTIFQDARGMSHSAEDLSYQTILQFT